MRNEIREGYELIVGHSAEKAREAIAKAEENGYTSDRVLRSPSGYLVPTHDVDPVHPPANVEEAQERAAKAAEAEAEAVEPEALELPKKTANNEEIDAWRDENLPGYEYPEDATNKELRIAALSAEVERHTALQDAEDQAAKAEGRTPTLLTYAPENKGE